MGSRICGSDRYRTASSLACKFGVSSGNNRAVNGWKTSGGAMTKKMLFVLAVLAVFGGIASAQDAKSVLQSATKAMGDVKSIQFSGTGHLNQLGQAFAPDTAWPETNVTSYTKTIDYASRSAKEELTRVEPVPPVKGGGRPFGGEDKQVNLVSGQYAWDQPGSAPVPQVAQAHERQVQVWLAQ